MFKIIYLPTASLVYSSNSNFHVMSTNKEPLLKALNKYKIFISGSDDYSWYYMYRRATWMREVPKYLFEVIEVDTDNSYN